MKGIAATCLALVACGPLDRGRLPVTERKGPDQGRYVLERVAVFDDGAAYGGHRDVYVLRDRETGQEWIGISGIGIAERGSHPAGKVIVGDER